MTDPTAARVDAHAWLGDDEIRAAYGAQLLRYDLAALLVEARERRQLTQAALADLAGVSQAYIARLESGEANPTIGRVGSLLACLWLTCAIEVSEL